MANGINNRRDSFEVGRYKVRSQMANVVLTFKTKASQNGDDKSATDHSSHNHISHIEWTSYMVNMLI